MTRFASRSRAARIFTVKLISRVCAVPSVKDAGLASVLPLDGRFDAFAADVEGHPRNPRDPAFTLWETVIMPDYLRVMGIPLLRGRAFSSADSDPGAPPVTLVAQSTARKFWPNQDPIGKHVKRVFAKDWVTVVGVVGDVNEHSLASRLQEYVDGAVYNPYGNNIGAGGGYFPVEMSLVARISNSQSNYANLLHRTVVFRGLVPPLLVAKTSKPAIKDDYRVPQSKREELMNQRVTEFFLQYERAKLLLRYVVKRRLVRRHIPVWRTARRASGQKGGLPKSRSQDEESYVFDGAS